MPDEFLSKLFSLDGQVALVTGGTGVLGGVMARGLAQAGAKVAVMGRRKAQADEFAAQIDKMGCEALALPADVLDHDQLVAARDTLMAKWGRVDILVNAAGGNAPAATVSGDKVFFDVPQDALQQVFNLNLMGTLLPSQIFGSIMAVQRSGSIVNISSMAAPLPSACGVAYAGGREA